MNRFENKQCDGGYKFLGEEDSLESLSGDD